MAGKKGSKGSSSSGKVARSAITGKYVKMTYANKHPKTTVVEKTK